MCVEVKIKVVWRIMKVAGRQLSLCEHLAWIVNHLLSYVCVSRSTCGLCHCERGLRETKSNGDVITFSF